MKTYLVTGEVTVQYAVWVAAEDKVQAEALATQRVKKYINDDYAKVVGRPRNVEVKDEDEN